MKIILTRKILREFWKWTLESGFLSWTLNKRLKNLIALQVSFVLKKIYKSQ